MAKITYIEHDGKEHTDKAAMPRLRVSVRRTLL